MVQLWSSKTLQNLAKLYYRTARLAAVMKASSTLSSFHDCMRLQATLGQENPAVSGRCAPYTNRKLQCRKATPVIIALATSERTKERPTGLDQIWMTCGSPRLKARPTSKYTACHRRTLVHILTIPFQVFSNNKTIGIVDVNKAVEQFFFRRDTAADLGHTAMLLLQLCTGGTQQLIPRTPTAGYTSFSGCSCSWCSEWNHGIPSHTRQLPTATVSPSLFMQAHANSTYPDRSHSIMAICIK